MVTAKKIPKKVKQICKKLKIRLTKGRTSRVKKSLTELLKAVKKRKMSLKGKKKTSHRRRRYKFGEGDDEAKEEKVSFLRRIRRGVVNAPGNIVKGVKATPGAIKRAGKKAIEVAKKNPVKATIAGLAVVGAATITAASGGLLGGAALGMANAAISSASSAGMAITGSLGSAARTVVSGASKAKDAIVAGSSVAGKAATKVKEGVDKVNEVKGKVENSVATAKELKANAENAAKVVENLTGKAEKVEENAVADVVKETVNQTVEEATKPVKNKNWWNPFSKFGSSKRTKSRKTRSSGKRKMTKRQAMDLIKRLSRR